MRAKLPHVFSKRLQVGPQHILDLAASDSMCTRVEHTASPVSDSVCVNVGPHSSRFKSGSCQRGLSGSNKVAALQSCKSGNQTSNLLGTNWSQAWFTKLKYSTLMGTN